MRERLGKLTAGDLPKLLPERMRARRIKKGSVAMSSDVISPPVVLFVDDEPSILSALRRLFRPQGLSRAAGG
jgi:hypothetical protein